MSNLFSEKMKPYLLSDQKIVQEFVLQALKEYPLTPAEWTNKILEQALQKEDKRTDLLLAGNSNALNENSIPILLGLLKVIDKQKRHLVFNYFKQLQPETVIKHEKELSSVFGQDVFTFYRFLLNADKHELQSEFDSVLSSLEKRKYFDHPLFHRAKQIQDRLIINQWYGEEHIDRILEDELHQPWFSYRGILAVRATGILKIEKYIPVLAKLLVKKDDALLEETTEALSKYQSDKAAEAVTPYASKEDTYIYAISVLANIKTDRAEKALLSIYQLLDMDGKSMVIEGLAHHLSENTFPLIEDYTKNNYSTRMFEMEPVFYGLHTVLGKDHPKMEKWKADFDEQEERFEKIKNSMPLVETAKIGRNEKCPCGSGKKHKKCCGA